MVLDLNNRLALDGRDPASYGGILWCFGLFDRPFNPPKSIWGTIRNRSTEGHVGRLNHLAYHQHVDRPQHTPMQFQYEGDGFVGVLLYRVLKQYGLTVTISSNASLTFPTHFNAKSTIEHLEVRSWQDAQWIEITQDSITWTDEGRQFWTNIWEQASNASISTNAIHLPSSTESNPVQALQSVLKIVHQHLHPIQVNATKQLTLW